MSGGMFFWGWVVAGLIGCLGLASEFRKQGGRLNVNLVDLTVGAMFVMAGPVSLAAYLLVKLEGGDRNEW